MVPTTGTTTTAMCKVAEAVCAGRGDDCARASPGHTHARKARTGIAPRAFLFPVNSQNATSSDWVILLEAGTIIGPSPERLRVARSTLERKIVKKYNFILKAKHFLVLEGYDPRIHAVFFCPQLYKYDPERKLVPLEGDEIGRLIARAVEGGITERRPWYDPSEKLPDRPIIDAELNVEFETLVVDIPNAQNPAVRGSKGGATVGMPSPAA